MNVRLRLFCALRAVLALRCVSQTCGASSAQLFEIAHTEGDESASVQRLRGFAPACLQLEYSQSLHWTAPADDFAAWDRLNEILQSRAFAEAGERERRRLTKEPSSLYDSAFFRVGATQFGVPVDTREPLIREALLLLDHFGTRQFSKWYSPFLAKRR